MDKIALARLRNSVTLPPRWVGGRCVDHFARKHLKLSHGSVMVTLIRLGALSSTSILPLDPKRLAAQKNSTTRASVSSSDPLARSPRLHRLWLLHAPHADTRKAESTKRYSSDASGTWRSSKYPGSVSAGHGRCVHIAPNMTHRRLFCGDHPYFPTPR